MSTTTAPTTAPTTTAATTTASGADATIVLACAVEAPAATAAALRRAVELRAVDGWAWRIHDGPHDAAVVDDVDAVIFVRAASDGSSFVVHTQGRDGMRESVDVMPAGNDVAGVAALVHAHARVVVAHRLLVQRERERDALRARVDKQEQALRVAMQERGQGVLRALEHERRVEIEHSTLASHDAGTGLVRHGRFRERLAFEVQRSLRTGEGLALLLVDVDGMAGINEAHGYDAGDAMLQRIARSLASLWLANDGARPPVLGRDVGDCFAIALPGTTAERAMRDGERVRALVHRLPLGTLRATVSVGIATWAAPLTAQQLVDAAHEALDDAKRRGGNRCAHRTGES